MPVTTKLRLGISMRVSHAQDYNEKRDSIANDWPRFLLREFPEVAWTYLPNIGHEIWRFCKTWKLNAFILTGGEDIGSDPERDLTENTVLDFASKSQLPVMGVCRGMQVIYQYYGGVVESGSVDFKKYHCATSHYIMYGGEKVMVNSYHRKILNIETLPNNLMIEARSEPDGCLEAISGNNILGVMWHPEREMSDHQWNVDLINNFFNIR